MLVERPKITLQLQLPPIWLKAASALIPDEALTVVADLIGPGLVVSDFEAPVIRWYSFSYPKHLSTFFLCTSCDYRRLFGDTQNGQQYYQAINQPSWGAHRLITKFNFAACNFFFSFYQTIPNPFLRLSTLFSVVRTGRV